jgi:hypothetical protein
MVSAIITAGIRVRDGRDQSTSTSRDNSALGMYPRTV